MRPTGLTILALLIAACGDAPAPAPLTRAAAIDLLLSPAGPGERAPALIPGLVSEDPVVAAAARAGLRAMGRDAVPFLIRAIQSGSPDGRHLDWEAGRILMEITPGQNSHLLNMLIERITDDDFRIEEFLKLFVEADDPDLDEEIAELCAMLSHSNRKLRLSAAAALGQLGPAASAAVPALVAALPGGTKKYAGFDQAMAVAEALVSIGVATDEVIAALVLLLTNSESFAVRSAADALGSLGVATDEVVTALELLLTNSDPYVVKDAREALHALGKLEPDPDAPPEMTLDQALAAFYHRETWADARAAVAAQGASAVPRLVEILGTGSPAEREAAAEALGLIGPDTAAAVPALTKALAAEERWVRLRAIEALGRIGPASLSAAKALTLILDGDDAEALSLAAAALADIGPEARDAVPALQRAVLAHDEDLELLNAAMRAIATMRRCGQGKPPPVGLTATQIEHAVRNFSTAPNFIVITVIDGKSGKREQVCLESMDLLSALRQEQGPKLQLKEAVEQVLEQKDLEFRFSNPAALKQVARFYSEVVFDEAREFLKDLTTEEIKAAAADQGSELHQFFERKPGTYSGRMAAIAHVLTERGLLAVRGCKPGTFYLQE